MTGNDGRQFNNDNPTAVLEHFKNKKRQIPLDIEHATELKGPKGEPAPEQDWCSENYKYISPAFLH
ncbi:phage protease [Vibrio sinaloensis]|uniref:phage protease n=1 Tax=Photobacterium sp. (strain ATCC 43367) TaxID=379097 RepID=UPI0020643A79|nr:phage protease [Vibrio sinaloensis]UPQ89162.1 phage protease [Vibrio sinaloensis]